MAGFLPSRTGRFRETAAAAAGEALDQHLQTAIADLTPPPATSEPKMRGMQRLAFLTQNAVADMDKKADAIADRIAAAQARGEQVMQQFDDHATSMEKAADDAERALAQITNGNPTSGL